MSHYTDSENSRFREDPNSPWFKVYNYVKDGSSVLDVGCSGGNFGKVLIDKKHCLVDGIELDQGDAKRASGILRKVYTNNLETEGDEFLGNTKYDIICFGDVLEHLVDPVNVLKLMKKHLTSDGGVAYSIPNMAYMSVRLMLLRGEFRYGEMGLLDKTHLHFYDEEEVRRIVQEAGYEFVKFDFVKRDIPRDVLSAELEKIGLRPDKKFLDSSKDIASSAYQFVGLIKPSSNQKDITKRPTLSPPINEMEKHIEHIKTVHSAQIDDHKNRIIELEQENDILKQKFEKLNLAHILKTAYRKVTKPKRS